MIPLLALALPGTDALILIVIVTLIVGLVFWAANAYLSVPQPFKGIVLFVIILIYAVWLFSVLT